MQLSKTLKPVLTAAVVGCLALGTSANAATVTAPIAVSATVQATCIVSAGAMAFGTYTGVVANSTATVSVTCTNTTPYNVGLDAGLTTGATVTTRQMKFGAVLLNYSLFSDTLRTVNWGNSAGSWVAGTGNGSSQALTVYGQVSAGQYVNPGAYADTITATVNY